MMVRLPSMDDSIEVFILLLLFIFSEYVDGMVDVLESTEVSPSLEKMSCINSANDASAGSTCDVLWNSKDDAVDDDEDDDNEAASL